MEKWQHDYPPALTQLFEPADGYQGEFGWICGYSADSDFLNAAVERFSGGTKRQRARLGKIFLAVLLDPGNPQIKPNETPGVIHLPYREPKKGRPFNLLHAKVALLGYRPEDRSKKLWRLRLIVSTGNWTRGTLQDSLDLVWVGEIDAAALRNLQPEEKQCCADIGAAWDLLSDIKEWFDDGVLIATPKGRDNLSKDAINEFIRQLNRIRIGGGKLSPRFFDSRGKGFLSQLRKLIEKHAGNTKRNYLCMGSGFYEDFDSGGANVIPPVLSKIASVLRKYELLSKSAEIDVFVNKGACQGVANNIHALDSYGWNVRLAKDPLDQQRVLHGKFIFSASIRNSSEYWSSGWAYIGSGNLTQPGFLEKMASGKGNLEAGILISMERKTEPELRSLLPVQWDDTVQQLNELNIGDPWEDRESQYYAAPVSCFMYIEESENSGWLEATAQIDEEIQVIGPDGAACQEDGDKRFKWRGVTPIIVSVRWGRDEKLFKADIPVMDAYGRICSPPLDGMDVKEAWAQLADFPLFPFEDEDEDEDENTVPPKKRKKKAPPERGNGSRSSSSQSKYPIRNMMSFIENIASRQDTVFSGDWKYWCNRLEQTLIAVKDDPSVQYSRRLELNILGPLWQQPFRPEFAKDDASCEGRRYEEMLNRITEAWGMSNFPLLGGVK